MSYLINVALKGRPAVVIGAGEIAFRKVGDLLGAGAQVCVIAPAACPQIEEWAAASRIRFEQREYAAGDLQGALLAIAATDDEELNARISRDAQSFGILVNVVDRPALCTFTLPAVVRRGDFAIAISTEGQCPALASVLREELSQEFGAEYAAAVRLLGEIRREMVARSWSGAAIRHAIQRLHESGIEELIRTSDRRAIETLIRTQLGDGFSLAPGLDEIRLLNA